ncbi:hypothetical protein Tco_0590855 [Tanacetum coccineum]
MIEDINQDARISLVTPTKVSSQEDKSEEQLGVLSAAKVLADAAKKNFNTYTRRKRAVSTSNEGVSTASRIFSTAEESSCTDGESLPSTEDSKDKGKALFKIIVDFCFESEQPKKIKKKVQIQMSLDDELAQKLYEEEQARFNVEQEAKARLLAELIDKRKKLQAAQRYDAIRNKPQTMSQQRKTMCTYMKNMAGYKMEHFKGKRFYEVKEMFDCYNRLPSFMLWTLLWKKKEQKEQKFDRDDLDKLWSFVKERFSSIDPTDDKETRLWVELKRLFGHDTDDVVWKIQRLSTDRGLLTLMLCNKLQVD